jgi:chorismate synthase
MAAGNSFGKFLVLTTFGESHGEAIGGVLDGFPAGIFIDEPFINHELARRRPGDSLTSTSRKEEDSLKILSGIFNGRSTGAPIAFIIPNNDTRPEDYMHLSEVFRPSHADFTYQQKYGIRDHRGGGRASARETVARVAAGAFAKLLLRNHAVSISSSIISIGTCIMTNKDNALHDPELLQYLARIKEAGDTAGGIVEIVVTGVPAGLGDPVFDKLEADLARAMLSINAAKGIEIGSGFASATMLGSEHNDPFVFRNGRIETLTNHSGGIQGGISNGMDIWFRVAFKPVSTLMMNQQTVNMQGEPVTLQGRGRHDVCVVPRAVPVAEAMTALVIADHLLRLAPAGSGNETNQAPR